MKQISAVEAVIFASKRGIEISAVSSYTGFSKEVVQDLILEIEKKYEDENFGIRLKKIGKKYSFFTKDEFSEIVSKLVSRPVEKLTSSQLEVLAVIYSKGPIKKSYIEEIRGKGSDNQILELLLSGLIKRKRIKAPGRPFAYSVTDSFFELFQISEIESLIPQEEPKKKEIYEKEEIESENSEVSDG